MVLREYEWTLGVLLSHLQCVVGVLLGRFGGCTTSTAHLPLTAFFGTFVVFNQGLLTRQLFFLTNALNQIAVAGEQEIVTVKNKQGQP